MSRDKNNGKACLIFTNVILLIVGIATFALAIYVANSESVPPILKEFSKFYWYACLAALGMIVFAILGFCASCGGCFLLIYSIAVFIISVALCILFVMTIILTIAVSHQDPDNTLVRELNSTTVDFITNPEYANEWIKVQNIFKCCGYGTIEMTGDMCLEPEMVDCYDVFFDYVSKFSVYIIFGVAIIAVIMIILTSSSCKKLKVDGFNN